VHGRNPTRFEQSYRLIATVAKLPGADNPRTDVLNMVSRWLENRMVEPWLMILDNADDATVFFPRAITSVSQASSKIGTSTAGSLYLPRSKGSILITSRNADVAAQLTGKSNLVLKVDRLEEDDAIKLFRKKLPHDHSVNTDWNMLINALERHPLAITQAAAYIAINSRKMSISRYLDYFRHNEVNQVALLSKDGADLRRDPETSNATVITWQISFDQIKLQNALAATILARMSVFDRQGIPRFLIHQDGNDDDLEFENAIGVLIGFSLVHSQADGENFDMYPLVHLSIKKWLEIHGEIEQRKEEALHLLSQKFPTRKYQNWPICEALEPHVQVVLRYDYNSQLCRLERAKILHNSADFALARGNYEVAMERAKEAARIRKEILGPDDPATLDSLDLLVSSYSNQERWKEAEELVVQVMETKKRVLGPQHPSTLTSVDHLGLVLLAQGKYEEAEDMHRQALEGREKMLRMEQPNILISANYLGLALQAQGKYEKAEKMHRQALEGREKMLGMENPDTLTSVDHLGLELQAQGKYEEAKKMYRRALEGREKMLGIEHPDILISVDHLGLALQAQEKYEEAKKMHRRTLEGEKKVLGMQNYTTTQVPQADGNANVDTSLVGSYYPSSVFSLSSAGSLSSIHSLDLRSAEEEFVSFLLNDAILQPLYQLCFESDRIGAQRFENNFRRLLKLFANDLRSEAQDKVQKSAVYFVRSRARNIAHCIWREYEPDRAGVTHTEQEKGNDFDVKQRLNEFLGSLDKTYQQEERGFFDHAQPLQTAVSHDVGAHDSSSDSDESDDGSEGEHGLFALASVKAFLLSSNAFQNLRENLQQFAHSPSKGSAIANKTTHPLSLTEAVHINDGNVSLVLTPWKLVERPSKLDKLKGLVEGFARQPIHWWPLRERVPECPEGNFRLSWSCVSSFYA
jgi:tetratricopeptide (TPR) repeat protein